MPEHQYSEANLGLASLKGKDQQRAQYLYEAAKNHDVCPYFTHFQHTVSGWVDDSDPFDHFGGADTHDIMTEYDSSWKVLTLVTTDGDKIAEDLDIEPEDFFEDDCLEGNKEDRTIDIIYQERSTPPLPTKLAFNMFEKVSTGEVSSEAVKTFCDQVFANLASCIRKSCTFLDRDWNVEPLREGDSSERLSWGYDRFNKTQIFSAQKFTAIVDTCELAKSSSSVNKMLAILTDISRKPNKVAFSDFLHPALVSLPSASVSGGTKLYEDLFRCVISYTNQFVPTKAQRIQDWSAPKEAVTPTVKIAGTWTAFSRLSTNHRHGSPSPRHVGNI